MIIRCEKCAMYFDDEYRTTICFHDAFPANDGRNNFRVNESAYLDSEPPQEMLNRGRRTDR